MSARALDLVWPLSPRRIDLDAWLATATLKIHTEIQREREGGAAYPVCEMRVEGLEIDHVHKGTAIPPSRAGIEFRESLASEYWPNLRANQFIDNFAVHLRQSKSL